jgi:hypothetical protein
MSRKKEVEMGIASSKCGTLCNKKLISPNYAMVDVTWTHDDFEDEQINIPTEEGG